MFGTNTRCLAMIDAILLMLENFKIPETSTPFNVLDIQKPRTESLSRAFNEELKFNFRILLNSRPLSYALRNVIGIIRATIQGIDTSLSTEECRKEIKKQITILKKV